MIYLVDKKGSKKSVMYSGKEVVAAAPPHRANTSSGLLILLSHSEGNGILKERNKSLCFLIITCSWLTLHLDFAGLVALKCQPHNNFWHSWSNFTKTLKAKGLSICFEPSSGTQLFAMKLQLCSSIDIWSCFQSHENKDNLFHLKLLKANKIVFFFSQKTYMKMKFYCIQQYNITYWISSRKCLKYFQH